MKGDFTRVTFDPAKHFSRVLQQQGRVQLDADSNEQTAILLHYIRTLAADLIGPFAGPVPINAGTVDSGPGFRIDPITENFNPKSPDFSISKGRYYVDGILCENDEIGMTYQNQKSYPNPPLPDQTLPQKYLIYLDVWERHINYVDDDSIREKALGGPDTASRAEVVCQVKLQNPVPGITFPVQVDGLTLNDWPKLVKQWQPSSAGCLKPQIKTSDIPNSPCIASPDAKYRGLENQLYRVEIHNSGQAGGGASANIDNAATFKWSRDNGSVVTGVLDGSFAGTSCKVESSRGFESGIWVELTNNEQELRGEPGTLVKLTKVDNDVLTFYSSAAQNNPPANNRTEKWPTKVRRWDQNLNASNIGVNITEGDWIDLEDSLQVQFQQSGATYRSGDYWLIPARVATGHFEWPVDPKGNVIAKPPFGIRHHYAPLALSDQSGNITNDLQSTFPPIIQPGSSYGEAGIGGEPSCPSSTLST